MFLAPLLIVYIVRSLLVLLEFVFMGAPRVGGQGAGPSTPGKSQVAKCPLKILYGTFSISNWTPRVQLLPGRSVRPSLKYGDDKNNC